MIVEWMDRFGEFATTWLWLVLLATWRAFPILLLVIGIGLAFRRKLTPSVQALLLTIVLVRLMIPISIGSPMSLHQPIDRWFSGGTEEPIHQGQPKFVPRHTLLPHVDQAMVLATHAKAVVPTSPAPALDEMLYLGILSMVIAVSIGLLLRSIFSHIRFAMGLRSCRLLDDPPLIDLVLREGDSLGVGRRPALREVQSLAAPAVFGLFRQTICLPPRLAETVSEQELRWVIRHELAHIRRRDIPVAIIASIAGAFHWFNPIVWILVSRLRAAMEAAADRLALQNVRQSEISEYGDLLLRFAQGSKAAKKAPTLGLISFSSGKHLKRRVESLLRDRKSNSLSAQCLSAGLVGTMALVGLTDAREEKNQPWPKIHLVEADSIPSKTPPVWFGPLGSQEPSSRTFVENYDLTSILQSVPKWLQEKANADKKTPLEQLTTFIPLPPSIKDRLHVEGTTLSAELTASEHHSLKQTLDIWKDGEPGQVAIEARFIQTNIQTASSIPWASEEWME